MQQHNLWNIPTEPLLKFRKRSTSFALSMEALEGLSRIASRFNIFRGRNPSVSGLLEEIGLNRLSVVSDMEHVNNVPLVHPDGLTERECFELGLQHYNEKRLPSFMDSSLAAGKERSMTFIQAYARGYMSTFIADQHGDPMMPEAP